MSTCKTSIDGSQAFHLFPTLPFELRIAIWLAAFPPASTNPLLRVTATSTLGHSELPEISYTFHINTDTTLSDAQTTPEYLAPFLKVCTESRDLYIEHFNLTLTLPSKSSIPIHYSPKTTLYVQNGLFISPSLSVMEGFRSIATIPVTLPPYFTQIQNLALPLTHFNESILDAYELYSPPTSPNSEWEPRSSNEHDLSLAREHEEKYDIPAINMLGCIFSRLTNLKNLCLVEPDDGIVPEYVDEDDSAEDAARSMAEVLSLFKRGIYPLDGEWEPPKVSVFGKVVNSDEREDSDD